MTDDLVADRKCSIPGCGRGGKLTRGMCARCYRYWLDHTPKSARPVAPRFARDFWDYVEKTHERGCWLWTGSSIKKGYGYWSGGGYRGLAHRRSWALSNGPVPDGLWVLHHCDNPPCVNPAHLYLGTVVENTQDAVARGRNYVPPRLGECQRGHQKSGDNLRIVRRADGVVVHLCRMCDNERSREGQKARRRARPTTPPPPGRLVTGAVIKRYGLGRQTIFEWQRRGIVKSVKVGRDAWWSVEEIEAAVAQMRSKEDEAA